MILQDELHYIVPQLINGKDVITPKSFQVVAPKTGNLLYKCSCVSVPEALSAVDAAQAAFRLWRGVPPSQKRDLFLNAAAILKRRRSELEGYMCQETGATDGWASFNITTAVDGLRDVAGRTACVGGMLPISNDQGTMAVVLKEPLGVKLGIAPWNAPYILGFPAVTYALAAGSTVILKAAELSPRCSWAIGDVFRDARLPAGVLNVIVHHASDAASVTQALIEAPQIKKVNFTGSTAVGKIIGQLAAANVKPVLLELGGKASAIVCEDADLALAAAETARGAFLNSGHICMSTERILVHKSVSEHFLAAFKDVMNTTFSQPCTLISRGAVLKNQQLLQQATKEGARLLYSNFQDGDDELAGAQMRPCAVLGVQPGKSMDIYYTESFGPSVSILEFEDDDDELKVANDTTYGLTSAIFTSDPARGLRMARGIESGAVHINSMTVHDEPCLPHGGVKSSGYGRFGSTGLDEWLWTKTVTFKK
ncbi:Aldehyde/histidinol dehydrogenase [Leptodontidium sp. MPI-SDFR-AT-0119]|nr:Aldehyde/histidinol dehydrogenase [Leptodontidium sp. MPI-SDFR-AT-0119]